MVKAFKVMVLFLMVSVVLAAATGPAAALTEQGPIACWNNCGIDGGR